MSFWWTPLFSLVLSFPAQNHPKAPFEVVTATTCPALAQRFQQTAGWTGGDVAYSIVLGPERTLWLFGDTWIGKIEAGRRLGAQMISNTAAWQLRDPKAPLRFFWNRKGNKPAPLLTPLQADTWYWPGDGVLVDGRLYLFCKLLRHKANGAPGLQFEWVANDLLQIENPQDEPPTWKIKRCRLPGGPDALRLGVACLLEGEYLYVYGLFPEAACKPLDKPLALARIHRAELPAMDNKGWHYWCRGTRTKEWKDRPTDPVPLFQDAAPEMTISRVHGINGLVATYTSLGLGADILVRHALRPEGPWSQPVQVYRCPETDRKLLLYGAKAHPELAERAGQIFLTYCRNLGDLADHVRRPDIYFPQGIEVQLRPTP